MIDKIKPVHIAWLLLACNLLHLLDEFYLGGGLPAWFSEQFSATLSERDFLLINFIAFVIIGTIALLHSLGFHYPLLVVAFGVLFFINGIIHLGISIYSASYSPGTATGLLLYLPLGYLIYKTLWQELKLEERIGAVSIGVLIHVAAFTIAMTI